MSKEILEAVQALAAEKGISSEKLMVALEDALLSAYKKTPGAAPYARVEMDRELGDFTVWELQIPRGARGAAAEGAGGGSEAAEPTTSDGASRSRTSTRRRARCARRSSPSSTSRS